MKEDAIVDSHCTQAPRSGISRGRIGDKAVEDGIATAGHKNGRHRQGKTVSATHAQAWTGCREDDRCLEENQRLINIVKKGKKQMVQMAIGHIIGEQWLPRDVQLTMIRGVLSGLNGENAEDEEDGYCSPEEEEEVMEEAARAGVGEAREVPIHP